MTSTINASLRRKGSIFDTSTVRLLPAGSSVCTFGEDHASDLFLMKKFSAKYQNTYKLDPDQRFETAKVQAITEQVLLDNLEDVEYNVAEARHLTKTISDKILKAVKHLGYTRHKIIAIVNIGQLRDQGIRLGSRCLWDTKRDNSATASYEGKTLWANATVFGVYYE
ncbi:dynein light chain Tctex-type 5-B-like [Clavelina lepadiformis]|uniref:Uncharacterized protein n=1 Tax=Clavelina lepadiformis TaxID=159417 RepID=A0ABP0F835_CLALP